MFVLGPYTFSEQDARATVRYGTDMIDMYPQAAHDSLRAQRLQIEQRLEGIDPQQCDIATLEAALRDVWPQMVDAADTLASGGYATPTTTATVTGLYRSNGGVPKASVNSVEVDFDGVVGDRQAARKHHGRPWQGLCIWADEVIAALNAEGHSIARGSAGENITIAGVEWSLLSPGCRLRVGTVECQVMSYTVPCAKLANLFRDRDFNRVHHDNGPYSRLYALVTAPGSITVGDTVTINP